jgi:hypothetical protein
MNEIVSKSRTVVGAFECVTFPQLNIVNVISKIDTGADNGAIHCVMIEEIREDGKKPLLRFIPMHNDNTVIETNKYIRSFVRGATGHRMRRYAIRTTVELDGKVYSIRIGLSDRSDMKYEVLIGRTFLSENNILVDVTQNTILDNELGDI